MRFFGGFRAWLGLALVLVAVPAWAQWFTATPVEAAKVAAPKPVVAKAAPAGKSAAVSMTSAAEAAPGKGGQPLNVARVRWLDKQTNRVQDMVLSAGTAQAVGPMTLTLTKCVADYGGEILQDVAWLEVREQNRDTPWFAGWMFNTFPEVATLDHPRYDVHLVGCGDKPRRKPTVANTAPVVQAVGGGAPEVGDLEAPQGDTEGPVDVSGTDPYFVPGVEKDAEPSGTVIGPPVPAQPVAPPAAPADQPAPSQPEAPKPEIPFAGEAAPAASPPAAPVAPAGDSGELHRMMDAQ